MKKLILVLFLAIAQMAFSQGKPLTKYSQQMLEANNLRAVGKTEKAEAIYNEILKKKHRDVDALIGRGFTRLRMTGRTEHAWEDFQKASVLSPTYIEAYVGMATCMKRMERKEDAQKTLEKARRICGEDKKKLQSLADIAWGLGHWDFARTVDPSYRSQLSKVEQQRQDYRRNLDAATRLRIAGQTKDSEKLYRQLLKENPGDVDVLTGLGFCKLRDKNKLDEAIDYFQQVVSRSPGYMDAHIGMATALKQSGRKNEALTSLNNAKEACDGDKQKLRKLAANAWNSGHWDFARTVDPSYKKQMSPTEIRNQQYMQKLNAAKRLRIDGFTAEAEKIYRALLKANPDDVDAMTGIGFCELRDRERAEDALSHFEQVVNRSPGYMDAHVGLATALKQTGRKAEVNGALDKAKEIAGLNPGKIKYLADTAWSFGHWDYARALDPSYNFEVTATERQHAEYLNMLTEARELRINGYTGEAEDIYNELLKRDPNDVDALTGIGFCKLRDQDRVKEALEDFLLVIKRSPQYIDAYVGAAICYKRSDQREELEGILEQCRTACEGNEKRMRYLATTAWREGYYPLAREIDGEYPPLANRELSDTPTAVRITYGHSWVEDRDDWDEVRISLSHRPRPDISLRGEYDHWWRYGETDFNLGFGASYRHNYRWAGKYNYEFSDIGGFLAEQRHNAELRYRLYRRLFIFGGPRFARYSGEWSEKGKIGVSTSYEGYFARATYTAGRDTKGESVSSYSLSAGYDYELRYGISAGYSKGEETVDFLRDDEVVFRSDDVDTIFIRGRYYTTDTSGISLGGMEEYRNSDLFRRVLTVSIFKAF